MSAAKLLADEEIAENRRAKGPVKKEEDRYRRQSSRFACNAHNVSVTMRLEYWLRESCCLLW
jgi:hypothetical protein